ncbi:MAG: hypothetical protein IJ635_11200 [Bacteroidaceae bacterium]|nr:hypothetical protein [Bacteroidaceae bacterium]
MAKKAAVSSTQNEQVKKEGIDSVIRISNEKEQERYSDYPQFPFWEYGRQYMAVITNPTWDEHESRLCRIMTELFEAFAPITGEALFSETYDSDFNFDGTFGDDISFPFLATMMFGSDIWAVEDLLNSLKIPYEYDTTEGEEGAEQDAESATSTPPEQTAKPTTNGEACAEFTQYIAQCVTNYLNIHTPIGRIPQYHIYSHGLRMRGVGESIHSFYATSLNQENTEGKGFNVYFHTA